MRFNPLFEKLIFGILKHLPIQKRTILFKSFGGQYGDNPKYISEELHRKDPDLNIVWGVSEKSNGRDFPDYVKKVKIKSITFNYYSSTAEVIVDNMSGIRGIRSHGYNKFYDYFLKRKNQLNISTWHGTPLKKIGCDVVTDNIQFYQTSANFMLSGNHYSTDIFKSSFNGIEIKELGTPRNDILFSQQSQRTLKLKLGLPSSCKIILYAPTFRSDVMVSGIEQLKKLDVQRLLGSLEKKFGGSWILVLRLHHEVLLMLREASSGLIDNKFVYDGNIHDDMAEYLAASDILLTDYSSSMFDYLLTNKPCYLFSFDKEKYLNDERGTYLDLEELPFSFSESVEQLYDEILNYDEEEVNLKRKRFLNNLGNIDCGLASEDVANYILSFMEE